ncbi:MAG: hypothetical protein KF816_06300 [Melioribacteraceae bacterium]|nr:hypothetical protein [Melioribacteraceae bacterium]
MQLKPSVKLTGITSELLLGQVIFTDICKKYNVEMVISSLLDSKHSQKSLHYSGNAAELRTSNIPDQLTRNKILEEIKISLGAHYDIVDEVTHFHIEYQPIDFQQHKLKNSINNH